MPTFFPTARPATNGVYSVDFAKDLPTGVTLVSAAWSIAIAYTLPGATVDPAPGSRLSGTAAVSGTVTSQRITGLIDGNDYQVTIAPTLSDSEILPVEYILSCREGA